MCGIVGLFDPDRRFAPTVLREVVARMGDALRHRGPDSEGDWIDPQAGLALGHRRLAIIDLSATAVNRWRRRAVATASSSTARSITFRA
jgi:asparagine synthase (glutamine-hydrolysing)